MAAMCEGLFLASMTLFGKLFQLMVVNATLEGSCMAFWFLQRHPTSHWHFRLMIDSLWRSFPGVTMHRAHLAILVPLPMSVSVNSASQMAIPCLGKPGLPHPAPFSAEGEHFLQWNIADGKTGLRTA